jgi:hypothetical protein
VLRRSAYALLAASFLAYFLKYTAGGLTSWFSDDDLMNLHYYWSRPWTALLKANVLFFSGEPRPLGGLYYCGIYWIWGFNPLPYRAGAMILVSLNLAILFLVVRELSGSLEAAALALLITGLNESFVAVYFDTGMIYDVLAFFFYYGAFYYYLRIRRLGRLSTSWQAMAFLVLTVCALNSKEIAVSLPVAILLYEMLWHPRARFLKTVWLSGAVALAFVVGLVVGPSNMKNAASYRPHLAPSLYLERSAWYLRLLSLNVVRARPSGMMGILVATVFIAFMLRKKHLLFASLMAMVSILPLAFIPVRGGFAFYVPSLYWSLWIAGVLVAVRKEMLPFGRFPSQVRLGLRVALPLALAAYVVPLNAKRFREVLPIAQSIQDRNRRYAEEVHRCLGRIPPGSQVLVLNDPWKDLPYEAAFLVRLSYGDPTIKVVTVRALRSYGGDSDPSKFDFLLDFADGRFQLPNPVRARTTGSPTPGG